MPLISYKGNKAFVGLGSCDNEQTERKIFEYANLPRLQIKRTGPSSWSVQLVCSPGLLSWSIQLVRPASLSSWSVQLVHPTGLTSRPIYTFYLTHSILHNDPCTLLLTYCILNIASHTLHPTHCILQFAS